MKIINEIIKSEGGSKYTNDPKDSGGPTKYGVTGPPLGLYRKLGRSATAAEVKSMTKAEAVQIYYKQYILRPNYDEFVNEHLQEAVVDFGVNAGPSRATKLLQRMVNDIEGSKVLKVDGMLGHHSLDLINKWSNEYPALFLSSFGYLRIKFYIDITNKKPKNKRFIKGWCSRANRYIPNPHKFDLTLLNQYVK